MNKIQLLTKDIEKSFKGLNRLTLVCVCLSFIFSLVVGLAALNYAERQREKIYVLDQGKSLLLALQTDAVMSKELEIKDHVSRFHELLFTLSPQKKTIQENLDRAFNLADKSAYEYSQDLAEKGYYSRLVSANISQQMIVDSVVFQGNGYPYQVKTFARQYVIRESRRRTRDERLDARPPVATNDERRLENKRSKRSTQDLGRRKRHATFVRTGVFRLSYRSRRFERSSRQPRRSQQNRATFDATIPAIQY